MKIDYHDIDDITILVIDGMLTIGSDQEFANVFQEQITRGRTKIVLDMTRVKYIDSLGIGQIAGAYTQLVDVDGQLVLARINEKIRELLRLTGLQDHISAYATVEEAVDAL